MSASECGSKDEWHLQDSLLETGFFDGERGRCSGTLGTLSSWKLTLTSVQFKMVSMHSKKPICAPPHLSEVSLALPLKWFQCSSDCWWPSLVLSRKIIKHFLFSCFSPPDNCWWDIFQTIAGEISLALCPQVVSEAHLSFSAFCCRSFSCCEQCKSSLSLPLSLLWAMQIIIIPSLVTTVGSANHHYPFPCHYCGQCESSLSLVTTVGNANHHYPLSLLWTMQIIIIPSLVTTVGSANHHYPLSLLWAMQIIIIPSLVTTVGSANHCPFPCYYLLVMGTDLIIWKLLRRLYIHY